MNLGFEQEAVENFVAVTKGKAAVPVGKFPPPPAAGLRPVIRWP